ncbi:glycosyltransferase family 1 protein [Sphingomonas sp. Y38-1Y]|uniref:glycosyltransferase family 4 protein n=1 Tax=Sphingomonas sp. Y38-1Y TaxID=3078265 RepID=UPI0028E43788|nr:glycosyltransferase family 1 protein [Sphingomonas sp. Y38-1Y]
MYHNTAGFGPAAPVADSGTPLRIALFSGNYNYVRDGANQALNRLVEYLERRGAAVRVYSPVSRTPAFVPQGTLVGVPSLSIPGRAEYRLGLGLPRSIRRDVRAFAPDLFHLSAPDWTGTAAQTFARSLGVPVVASLHTRFEKYADFYGARFVRPAMERHLDRFYGRSDRVLVPTQAIADEFEAAGLGGRIAIWGRGVDRVRFDPQRRSQAWRARHGIPPDGVALLFFGRLVREKGLADFADVCDRLTASGVKVHPVVVGEGPERGWLAKRLPAARLTGHLQGEALGEAVASADIFLNPSITEAFGNVTLEAMASGLPSVSVDVASASALLNNGSGLLYTPGDLDAATAHVARLAAFAEMRGRMGRRARDASASYGWDRASEQVWVQYHQLLGRGDVDALDLEAAPRRRAAAS